MIDSEVDKKKLRDCLMELSASMARVEGEKEFQREAVKNISDALTLEKKFVQRCAKWYHTQRFHTMTQEEKEAQDLYLSVFPVEK